MAYTKTNWVNNGTPPLSAANLNNIENGIYSCDSRLTTVENVVGPLSSYSTTETAIGVWVDGTTIYRKVFLVETSTITHTSGQTITVSLGANHNIKMLLRFDCITVGNNSVNSEVNKYITPNRLDKNANTLTLDCNAAYTTNSITVIIEYTKTS